MCVYIYDRHFPVVHNCARQSQEYRYETEYNSKVMTHSSWTIGFPKAHVVVFILLFPNTYIVRAITQAFCSLP